jgi:CBS domain-containing protein
MEMRREERELLVEDAMQPYKIPILSSQDSVTDALSRLESAMGEFFFVWDERGEWHGITRDLLQASVLAWDSDVAVGNVLRGPPLPRVHPDEALDVALQRLGHFPYLPVVNRADFGKLEGVISLPEILEAYRKAGVPAAGEGETGL